METSDAELEQLCLDALNSHAATSNTEDPEGQEELHKADGEEPKKAATTEGAKTEAKTEAKTDEKADGAPEWFKAFEKKTSDKFEQMQADMKVIAKKPQASVAATPVGTEPTAPAEKKTLWQQVKEQEAGN